MCGGPRVVYLPTSLHGFEKKSYFMAVCRWPRRPIMAKYTFAIMLSFASIYLQCHKAHGGENNPRDWHDR